MAKARKLIGAALIAAMLGGAAAPAAARPWGYHGGPGWGYGHGRGWHRHHDGDGAGNFLLGAIVAGGVIAAISSANRNKVAGQAERGYDAPPPPGSYSYDGADAGPPPPGSYPDDRADAGPPPPGADSGPPSEEDAAVDACADAAGAQAANRYDPDAQVDDITYSGRDGQGWRVEGNVATGNQGQVRHHFVCGLHAQTVDYVQFVDQSSER